MSRYIDVLESKSEPILYEEEKWFIILAKRPLNEGHVLIIPKEQQPVFFKLPWQDLQRGYRIATTVSKVLSSIYRPPQITLFIKGFTNDDHAHIHVAPVYASEDTDVDLSRPQLSSAQMAALANKLSAPISAALQEG